MRTSMLSLLFIVGLAMFIGASGPLWAEPISITLTFDKEYYEFGEPVMVTVNVTNTSGNSLFISEGFKDLIYYLDMRVIDPAGRVLLANRGQVQLEIPDAPPVPFVLDVDGTTILRTVICEVLPYPWEKTSGPVDLRLYYPLKFPGKYSAQVELSAMIFNESKSVGDQYQCSINPKDTVISNTLRSTTEYFYMKGRQVHVAPDQWKLRWWDGMDLPPYIEVQITPEPGKTVNDYGINANNYFLNNVKATRVKRTDTIVQAFFNPEAAIKSLGPSKEVIEVKGVYDVVVLGTLVDDNEKIIGMFGGGDKIRVVNE